MAILSEEQKYQNIEIINKLKTNEKFVQAIFSGALATICMALIWALVALNSGFNFSAIALFVGAIVGFTIQYVGKGYRLRFSILGMGLSFVSCLLGYYFTYIGIFIIEGRSMREALENANFSNAFSGFGLMDLLFLIAACGAGFVFARRKLKPFEQSALFKQQMGLLESN